MEKKEGRKERRVRRREEDWELEGPQGKIHTFTQAPTEGI